MKIAILVLLIALVSAHTIHDIQTLWTRKQPELYGCYRIPALLRLEDEILVTAIEARQGNCNDAAPSDTFVRVSKDNGETWSDPIIIDFFSHVNGTRSTGEPALVYDKITKTLFVITEFFYSNAASTFAPKIIEMRIAESKDFGFTWSLNQIIQDPGQTSPTGMLASGIQLDSGRLAVCYRRGNTDSFAFLSDDHGVTWRISTNSSGTGGSECQITQLHDGRLYQTSRSYYVQQGTSRLQSFSNDGGETWEPYTIIPADIIPDPNCQGSVCTDDNGILYLSHLDTTTSRVNITINRSKDSATTWDTKVLIRSGPAAYSSITALSNGSVGIAWEGGDSDPYEKIFFTVVDFE